MALDTVTSFQASVRGFFENAESPLFSGAGGRQPRSAQVSFASDVARLFSREYRIAMLQAETGTGKTLGYLAPAILDAAASGRRVIVSTQSIALQDQVMETLQEITPVLEREIGRPLSFARRIGKRNFLDASRFEEVSCRYIGKASEWDEAIDQVATWIAESPDRLRHDLENFLSEAEISLPFPLSSFSFSGNRGEHAEYDRMIRNAANADILVINHALLALDLMTWGRVIGMIHAPDSENGTDPVTLVVDEADLLPGVVRSMSSGRMPFIEIRRALREMNDVLPVDTRESLDLIADGLQEISDHLRKSLPTRIVSRNAELLDLSAALSDKETAPAVRACLSDVLDRFSKISSCLESAIRPEHEITLEILSEMQDISMTIRGLLSGRNEKLILYWSPIRGQAGLARREAEAGRILSRAESFTDQESRILFTSATMTTQNGDALMRDFAGEIGFPVSRLPEVLRNVHAPKYFGQMNFLAPRPENMPPVFRPDPNEDMPPLNPSHGKMVLDIIRKARSDGGNVLVLVPAFRDIRMYRRLLQESSFQDLRPHVLFDEREARKTTRERFRTSPGLVLLSPAAWVGMDMPGVIDHIVIPRLPIAPRDIIESHDFESWLKSKGKNVKSHRHARSMARAVRKLRQGIGRGIRTETDAVSVWLCDPRWPFPDHAGPRPAGIRKEVSALRAIPDRFRLAHEDMEIIDLKTGGTVSRMVSGLFSGKRGLSDMKLL